MNIVNYESIAVYYCRVFNKIYRCEQNDIA